MRIFATLFVPLFLAVPVSMGHALPLQPTPGQTAENLPVAQYLGGDLLTERRVFELLGAQGIRPTVGGSLGYSVWVDAADRVKARRILRTAVAAECLDLTIFADDGHVMETPQPPRCNRALPAPVSGGTK